MRLRTATAVVVGIALATVAVEIALFVAVARIIGAGWALLLLVALSLLGTWVLKREGVRSWRRLRATAADGKPPGREVTNGLAGLMGALLLTIPGFFTAIVGALLLVPPVRRLARNGLERHAQRYISPALAGDFFGPRWVKARWTTRQPPPAGATTPPVIIIETQALEGEIIDPPDRPRGAQTD